MGSPEHSRRADQRYKKARADAYTSSPDYDRYLAQRMSEGAAVAVVALVALVFVALPALLGAALHRWGLRRLRPVEVSILAAATIAVFWLTWPGGLDRYAAWLWGFAWGDTPAWPPPLLPILGLSVLLAALWFAASRTGLRNIIPLFAKRGLGDEDLVPDDEERARINIVTTPAEADLVDPSAHHLTREDDPAATVARNLGLGIDRFGNPFMLTEKELGTHTMLLGSTGSGKSETIKRLAGDLAMLGWDGMILDCKEDTARGGLRDFAKELATDRAMPYQETSLSDPQSPNWFNALQGLNPDEARDAMLAMQEFEAPYYQALNEKLLGQLVTLHFDAHRADPDRFPYPDIYAVGATLSKPLKQATKAMRATVLEAMPGRTEEDFSWLKDPDQDVVKSAPGLGARLTSMYETEAGRTTLRPGHPSHPSLDVTAGGISYVGVNSLGLPSLSKMVSTAVLLRFAAYAGSRSGSRAADAKKPRFLIIDEANFIDTGVLLNLMSRCRSAGIAVVLCSQSPLDFDAGGSRFKEGAGFAQLAQNTNVSIIMAQGDRQAAEVCADYLGTMDRAQVSQRMVDGELVEEGTVSSREQHKVSPQQLTELRTGEAVVKVRVPEPKLAWVKVAMFTLARRGS